jgi:hypothetical protein
MSELQNTELQNTGALVAVSPSTEIHSKELQFEFNGQMFPYEVDEYGENWFNLTQICKSNGRVLQEILDNKRVQDAGTSFLKILPRGLLEPSRQITQKGHFAEFGLTKIKSKTKFGESDTTWAKIEFTLTIAAECNSDMHAKIFQEFVALKKGVVIEDDEESKMRQLAEAANTALEAIIARKAAEKAAKEASEKAALLEGRVEKAVAWYNEKKHVLIFAQNSINSSGDQSMMECSRLVNAQCLSRHGIDAKMSRNDVFKLLRRIGVVMKTRAMYYENYTKFFSTKMVSESEGGKPFPTMFVRNEYLHKFVNMLLKEAMYPGRVKSFLVEMNSEELPAKT